ncbi:hypothetical protein SANTM175S_00195 [Streptomyces antimycoticus]
MLLRHGRSTGLWNTIAMSSIPSRIGRPLTRISPSVGSWRPEIVLSSVVFPLPDCPTIETNCPGFTWKSSPLSTVLPWPSRDR